MQINQLFGGGVGGEARPIIGNGLVGHNAGQTFGRTIIADVPILVDHPDGIGGSPRFRMLPQSMCIAWGRIDLSMTGDQMLAVRGGAADESYVARKLIFGNVRGKVSSATVDLWSARNGTGRLMAEAVDLTPLDVDDPRLIVEADIDLGYSQSAPWLYLRVSSPESQALACDVYVYADQLHMPGLPLP